MEIKELIVFLIFLLLVIINMYFFYKLARNVNPERNPDILQLLLFNALLSDDYFNEIGIKYKRKMIVVSAIGFILMIIYIL